MISGIRRERVESRNFMVGLFLPTMSGGWTVSHATNLTTYRYEYLRELALLADYFQLDYLFAGGGYMPKMTRAFKFRDRMTDALALAAAFGTLTTYPMVISTVHILYRHAPLFLAKLGAGIDEVSNGGWGMNVVCGLTPRSAEIFDFPDLGHSTSALRAGKKNLMVRIRDWQLLERREPSLRGQAPRQGLADGRAKTLAVLRQRHRQAVHRAGAVQGAPKHVEVVLQPIGHLSFRPE